MKSIVIIGGGIVGLATAYKLSCKYNDISITILEKENDIGQHQSTHNSGVLHCGLYYKPGSLKSQLSVDGIKQMTDFCIKYNIPHEICGKLVVSTNKEESIKLNELFDRGTKNGLKNLKKLNKQQMLEIEPNVGGIEALHVPQEGIVDYKKVIQKLSELIKNNGHIIKLNSKVISIKNDTVFTEYERFNYDILINCTGLYSDTISKFTSKINSKIIPFRGEYYKLKPESSHLVNNLIYPVPDPKYPFLGVHFTRLINGGIEAGPNAVLAFSREGYSLFDINLIDIFDYITFKGFWKFIFKHKYMCFKELYQSISKKQFTKALQKLVPNIKENDLIKGGAGVRAQAMTNTGELIQDFEIVIKDNVCNVINCPSPAATSSLSIADYIINQIKL
jgi:L-2-hydroxyglutarate oxidase